MGVLLLGPDRFTLIRPKYGRLLSGINTGVLLSGLNMGVLLSGPDGFTVIRPKYGRTGIRP